jgi:hypothetical protein
MNVVRKGNEQKIQTLILAVLLLFLVQFSALLAQYPEYQIKAILLGRLARHIEWPKEVEMKYFVIGVYGENPFGDYLKETYPTDHNPSLIKNKIVKVRYMTRIEGIPGCHLLFITELPKRSLAKIIEFTRDKPILTVGDTEDYETQGVQVRLAVGKAALQAKPNAPPKGGPNIYMIVNQKAMRQAGLLAHESLLDSKDVELVNPYDPAEEKAQQLEPITRFITWPQQAQMANLGKPFKIRVIGDTNVATYLEKIYKKKKLKDKAVDIATISSVQEIDDPHLLFISKKMKPNLAEIISFTKNKPILTIGDTEGFKQAGVHITFFFDRLTLCFEINEEAARAAGFDFSYHLMKMARINHHEPD